MNMSSLFLTVKVVNNVTLYEKNNNNYNKYLFIFLDCIGMYVFN